MEGHSTRRRLRCIQARQQRVPLTGIEPAPYGSVDRRSSVELQRESRRTPIRTGITPAFGRRDSHVAIRLRGEEGTRTPNLLLAKQLLFQLSYNPMQRKANQLDPCSAGFYCLIGAGLRWCRLVALRSVEKTGFEPVTPALPERCTTVVLQPQKPHVSRADVASALSDPEPGLTPHPITGESRDREIRTPNPLLPKQVPCQVGPYPVGAGDRLPYLPPAK